MSTTTTPTRLSALERQAATIATTGAAAVLAAAPGTEPAWAKPAVALGSLLVFVGMVVIAYLTHDQQMQTLLGGAVIGMASQAGNYYLGSSSGSAAKTNLLAASTRWWCHEPHPDAGHPWC